MLHERDSTSHARNSRTTDRIGKVSTEQQNRRRNLIPRSNSSSPQGLAGSLKNLYASMGKTTESVTPTGFLTALRQAFPQFAEVARGGGAMKSFGTAYAQQGE